MGVYIKNTLGYRVNQCSKNALSNTEHSWVDNITNKDPVTIGVVHKQPDGSTAGIDSFTNELNKLCFILNNNKSTFYCAGDFNNNLMNLSSKDVVRGYANMLSSCNSRCLIDVPTQMNQTFSTLLDNIYINDLTMLILSGVLTNFDLSDNYSIFVIICKKTCHKNRQS